jgi:hypothetical protein
MLRAFEARDGTRWEVWEAHPAHAERRRQAERRMLSRTAPPDRRLGDVRRDDDDEGWLVFRSAGERRRQRPIPPTWEKMSESELRGLLNAARPSGPRSRMT